MAAAAEILDLWGPETYRKSGDLIQDFRVLKGLTKARDHSGTLFQTRE